MAHPGAARDERTLRIALNQIDELFNAPDVNPFSTHPLELLGESGIEYLRKRMLPRWRRRQEIDRLIIELPAPQSPEAMPTSIALKQQVCRAIHRFCAAQIEADQQALRLSRGVAHRQGLIALVVTLFALAMLASLMAGNLGLLPDFARGVLIVLSLFAASLAIWDALESTIFDWVPIVLDRRIYQMISTLEVVIEFPNLHPAL